MKGRAGGRLEFGNFLGRSAKILGGVAQESWGRGAKNSPPGLGGVPFACFLANGGVVYMLRSHLIDIRAAHRLKWSARRASITWLRAIPYHPVCAFGAATPPKTGGEFGDYRPVLRRERFPFSLVLRSGREFPGRNA